MNIRESMEQREQKMLSPYAALSLCSRGRERQEEECDVRTVYQRDRDRILHSKAFRRMKDKTQVFVAPQGDHYRTRLTHTLEVSQIARTIAKALRLNEEERRRVESHMGGPGWYPESQNQWESVYSRRTGSKTFGQDRLYSS